MASGQWRGYYGEKGKFYKFQVNLTFCNGTLNGEGKDSIGSFTFEGTTTENSVRFLKQYKGKHSVDYEGTLAPNDRSMIGTYKVAVDLS